MYKFSKTSLDTLSTVYGPLQALVHSVLSNSPYDFGIPNTGGKRTAEEQNVLYKKGWSKLDGYKKKSYHQSGKAVDIFLVKNGKADYESKDRYKEVADLFKKHFDILKDLGVFSSKSTITWGGDWNGNGVPIWEDPNENFIDIPHFEIRNV
jgi:peptidoglycan L-alanyl-D-glutamate endopeptidase CwlK